MSETKLGYNEAYSLKTPEDSKKLYKKWAETYDEGFALKSNYVSPEKISKYFNQYSKNSDSPILDVGAGTGLVGEYLNKSGNKKIIGIDISAEMLKKAEAKNCYSSTIVADITKKIPLEDNSFGAIVSAGTFTHGHVGAEAIDELLRITKPGGLFVISINSKVFIKGGFEDKFNKIKNIISEPIFNKYSAHGQHKEKKFNAIKIFATIFRKKI